MPNGKGKKPGGLVGIGEKIIEVGGNVVSGVSGAVKGAGEVAGAAGTVAEAAGEVAVTGAEVITELVKALNELIGLLYKGGAWSADKIESLVSLIEWQIEKLSLPSEVDPAPGSKNFEYNAWSYYYYNELYYTNQVEEPKKEYEDAKEVLERLKEEERTAYREIDSADATIKELQKHRDERINNRDWFIPEWGSSWHQINGTQRKDKNGVVTSRPYVGEDKETFETVKDIEAKIEEQRAIKNNALGRLNRVSKELDKELGVSAYSDGVLLTLPNMVDLMQEKVDELEETYMSCEEQRAASEQWRKYHKKQADDNKIKFDDRSAQLYIDRGNAESDEQKKDCDKAIKTTEKQIEVNTQTLALIDSNGPVVEGGFYEYALGAANKEKAVLEGKLGKTSSKKQKEMLERKIEVQNNKIKTFEEKIREIDELQGDQAAADPTLKDDTLGAPPTPSSDKKVPTEETNTLDGDTVG